MCLKRKLFLLFMAAMLAGLPPAGAVKKRHEAGEPKVESTEGFPALLWRDPTDIASRNLYYGPGGEKHQPRGTFKFVKEDLEGSNPKFDVRDEEGVKWRVKLGEEARPETAATRLVWAAGYFANEDYFVGDLHVQGMPARLKRGYKLVEPDGSVHNVRLKREHEKKIGNWLWSRNPFVGTRELNGLRILMALINNWDLKDENNAIYERKDRAELIYMIGDLGSSFGTAGPSWPHAKAKGNLESYASSKFIVNIVPEFVDFEEPAKPDYHYLVNPAEYRRRGHLHWIGTDIPRTDARWMGELLSRLSSNQIRDAFRAAGYRPEEVNGFAAIVEQRIAALKAL